MKFLAVILVSAFLVSLLAAQQPVATSAGQAAAAVQQALDQRDLNAALRLAQDGLHRFPDDPSLQLELARVYVYQKHDSQAIDLVNNVLRRNPASRDARLELAQIYGYRSDYKRSNALYRELLASDSGDEAAAIGLVRNLLLQGRRAEASQELHAALQGHPSSLVLQEFQDFLTSSSSSGGEAGPQMPRRVQAGASFFSDSSGNRSLYSSQAFGYEIGRNLTSRFRMDETALWKTAVPTVNVYSGSEELRWKFNRYFALRGSGGAVRFPDSISQATYSGDLELYPWKGLLLSGGYSRFPILPSFESVAFDLLSTGWHSRVGYHTRNFSLDGSLFLTRYSDGNRAEREYGDIMRWFGGKTFSVGAGYAFRHIHFQQQLNNGYFSPAQYRNHLGQAGLRLNIGRIYHGEYLGNLGVEQINQGPFTTGGELLLRNEFILRRWELEADYSHYQLVQSTAAFKADMFSAGLGYRF